MYRWLRIGLALIIAYLLSSLVLLQIETYFLPPPIEWSSVKSLPQFPSAKFKSDFQYLVQKQVFSPSDSSPPTLRELQMGSGGDQSEDSGGTDDTPVPSSLPLNLVGTIVHSNPSKSIAHVEVKSKNLSIAVRVGNTIDTLARLEKVERGKIIFRNLNNNRREYIEIKETSKLRFSAGANLGSNEEVRTIAPNKYEVSREDVNRYTKDLSSVLQQASMLPVRGPGGEVTGFRFVNIQPDSIFNKLGFQVGDIIKGVNGEFVDSPAKALELYNALKGSNNIRITIERNGQEQELEYTIK